MKISSLKEAHPEIDNQPPINKEEDGGFLQANYSKITREFICRLT